MEHEPGDAKEGVRDRKRVQRGRIGKGVACIAEEGDSKVAEWRKSGVQVWCMIMACMTNGRTYVYSVGVCCEDAFIRVACSGVVSTAKDSSREVGVELFLCTAKIPACSSAVYLFKYRARDVVYKRLFLSPEAFPVSRLSVTDGLVRVCDSHTGRYSLISVRNNEE